MAASLLGWVAGNCRLGAAFAVLGAAFAALGAPLATRALRVRCAASAGSKLAKDGASTAIPTRKPIRTPQLIRCGPCMYFPLNASTQQAITRPNCPGDCKALTSRKDYPAARLTIG